MPPFFAPLHPRPRDPPPPSPSPPASRSLARYLSFISSLCVSFHFPPACNFSLSSSCLFANSYAVCLSTCSISLSIHLSPFIPIYSYSFPFIPIYPYSFPFIHIYSYSFPFIPIHSYLFPFIPIHSYSFPFIPIHSHSFLSIPIHSNSFLFLFKPFNKSKFPIHFKTE